MNPLSGGCLAGASRETPFDVAAAAGLMAAVMVIVPTTWAILLGGMTTSPQMAPECTSLMTDFFETSPPGLTRRRKQQIDVFFLLSLWWGSYNHLEIIWRLSKHLRPQGHRLRSVVSVLAGQGCTGTSLVPAQAWHEAELKAGVSVDRPGEVRRERGPLACRTSRSLDVDECHCFQVDSGQALLPGLLRRGLCLAHRREGDARCLLIRHQDVRSASWVKVMLARFLCCTGSSLPLQLLRNMWGDEWGHVDSQRFSQIFPSAVLVFTNGLT